MTKIDIEQLAYCITEDVINSKTFNSIGIRFEEVDDITKLRELIYKVVVSNLDTYKTYDGEGWDG